MDRAAVAHRREGSPDRTSDRASDDRDSDTEEKVCEYLCPCKKTEQYLPRIICNVKPRKYLLIHSKKKSNKLEKIIIL